MNSGSRPLRCGGDSLEIVFLREDASSSNQPILVDNLCDHLAPAHMYTETYLQLNYCIDIVEFIQFVPCDLVSKYALQVIIIPA